MIGFFDSGLGGLTILRQVIVDQPGSYLYLGDNAHAPYGSRSSEEILTFTIQGVRWLIDQGCHLIVLACNTASANALRIIQQEWLPKYAPHIRVLGILVPTVEAITGVSWMSDDVADRETTVLIFATPATVSSGAYEREIRKRIPRAEIFSQSCPKLVTRIEAGASREVLRTLVDGYVLETRLDRIDHVLLGCTHYALIEDLFQTHFSTPILSQPKIVSDALRLYLHNHPELVDHDSVGVHFVTTGNPVEVAKLTAALHLFGTHSEKQGDLSSSDVFCFGPWTGIADFI